MTPGWNQAELNANPAIFDYNNPHTPQASLYVWAVSHMDVPGYDRDYAPMTEAQKKAARKKRTAK